MKITKYVKQAIYDRVFEAYKEDYESAVRREKELVDKLEPQIEQLQRTYREELRQLLAINGVDEYQDENLYSASGIIQNHYAYSLWGYSFPNWFEQGRYGSEVNAIINSVNAQSSELITQIELGKKTENEMLEILRTLKPRRIYECMTY